MLIRAMVLGLMRRDRIAFVLTVLVGVLICGPLRAVGQQASLSSPSPADTGGTANATVQKYLIKGTTEAQLGDYEEAILYFETALDRA
ncbi:MAG: hypothetical protein BRD31_04890, partial [Bacteroidetes bacterium QH_2_64_26]